MEKSSTTNDIRFSLSLDALFSLSSLKGRLSRGNLPTYEGETIHNQEKDYLNSKSDFSVATEDEALSPSVRCDSSINIEEDILSPNVSDDNSIAIFSRLNQNQASQNYIIQIRTEPTTIAVARRRSTNSITTVGSCARFRGGSDSEASTKGKKGGVEEDSKAPLTVWERGSNAKLSSTSGESVAARSSSDTVPKRKKAKRNKDSYFKRLSSRLSEGGSKRDRASKSRGSSPQIEMTDKRFKSKVDKSMTPSASDPKYFGPGRNSSYEGEGEENVNKSEGSNKREGRGRSFFSRRKTRSSSRSNSKSKSPQRESSKTGKKPSDSESPYGKEPVNHEPVTKTASAAEVHNKADKNHSGLNETCGTMGKPGCCCCGPAIPPFQNQEIQTDSSGPGCCCCQSQTPPFQSQQIQTDSSGPGCCCCESQTPPFQNQQIQTDKSGPPCCSCSSNAPFQNQQIQTDKSGVACSSCGTSTVQKEPPRPKPQEKPDQCPNSCKPMNKGVLSVRSDIRSTIEYETIVEGEKPNFQTPNSQSPRTQGSKGDQGSRQGPGVLNKATNTSKQPAEPQDKSQAQTSDTKNGVHVNCKHCGCGLPPIPDKKAKQDDNVSDVLWAVAKVTVFKDGTRNFEILESTSVPPGHYLMPGNEEFVIVPIAELK